MSQCPVHRSISDRNRLDLVVEDENVKELLDFFLRERLLRHRRVLDELREVVDGGVAVVPGRHGKVSLECHLANGVWR